MSTQDPRERTKVWLDAYLTAANLTKDDDVTEVKFITAYGKPQYSIYRVFRDKKVDLIFSISTPETEPLPLGIGYKENMPITIFCIDKTGITGTNLRWKAELELRTVAEDHPLGSLRTFSDRITDNEQNFGDTVVYSVRYILRYKRYV